MLAHTPCPEYGPHRPTPIVTIRYNSRNTNLFSRGQEHIAVHAVRLWKTRRNHMLSVVLSLLENISVRPPAA
jgi:hypothetical protein